MFVSGTEDDEAYHRSARRMAAVLAAIVIVIFAAIFIPPILNPIHEQFSPSVSVNSSHDLSLNLSLNATRIAPGGSILFSAWLNNTSSQVNNVTAQDSWIVTDLGPVPCFQAMPMRLGVMLGYYTADNFSLGSVLPLSYSSRTCPSSPAAAGPPYFVFEASRSTALVLTSTGIVREAVSLSVPSDGFQLGGNSTGFRGVMTVLVIDEWGDTALTHFLVE